MSTERMSDDVLLALTYLASDGSALGMVASEARRARSAELALQAEVEMLTQQRNDETAFSIRLCEKLNVADRKIERLQKALAEARRAATSPKFTDAAARGYILSLVDEALGTGGGA